MSQRILVVDDDSAIRELLVAQVSSMGYDCDGASGGTEALAQAQIEPRPDLILSDLEMPECSGLELLRRIKAYDDHIEVVMVTAHEEIESVRQCLKEGAYDYLLKPYDLVELSDTIGRALERRELKRELREYQIDLERKVEESTREVLQTRDITLITVAKLAECRDDSTGYHLDRIQWYSRLLAEAAATSYPDAVTDRFVDQVFKSSPLHDIGKVAIPDSVLLKEGPLSEEEWVIMKSHTLRGGDTLREVIDLYTGSSASPGPCFYRRRWRSPTTITSAGTAEATRMAGAVRRFRSPHGSLRSQMRTMPSPPTDPTNVP